MLATAQSSQGLHYINPRLPSCIELPDNLECGNKIYIHGAVANAAKRFSINLQDKEKEGNTFLHFNPRFDDGSNIVVRNSFYNGSWGNEERDGESPFVMSCSFVMLIVPTVEGYEVTINDGIFTLYRHRDGMPLCNVKYLTMAGDVVCYGIHILLSSIPIPLTLAIPGKTALGDVFCLKGDVPTGAQRFVVNLQCGREDTSDIVYHLNPRFDDGVVVCNNKSANSWADEERNRLTIAPGDKFEFSIAAAKEGFLAFVNGCSCGKFNHRLNMSSACLLRIDGDVNLFSVSIDSAMREGPPIMELKTLDLEKMASMVLLTEKPTVLALPSTLQDNSTIVCTGIIDKNASRFYVNLQCGPKDDDDIALHLNPRFDQQVLIINGREGGQWQEELSLGNEMVPGSRVEICISLNGSHFRASIDGIRFLPAFTHRIDFRKITHVVVGGDIAVRRLQASI